MISNNTLIICEKPSVGRDIASALEMAFEDKGGVLRAPNNIAITWAFGHLLSEAKPDDISDKWRGRWTMESLPIVPERIPLVVADGKSKQLNLIKNLIGSPDFEQVICATDAGREGEHIYRCILRYARKTDATAPSIPGKRQSRLWVKDCTKEGLRAAFRGLLPGQAKDSLADAARARAEADYCVGMTMTRAVTVRAGGQLINVGRVISPALRLLAERQREHDDFQPTPYFIPVLDVDGFACEWIGPPEAHPTREDGQWILDAARDARITVVARKEGPESLPPPLAFSLTSLQRACNAAYGLTAAQTLTIAQSLYETRKCITYPRTDAEHISLALYRELDDVLGFLPAQYQDSVAEARRNISVLGRDGKRPAVVDDAKLTDHHAIIPTRNSPRELSDDENRVYDLIVRRFLASLMPQAVYQAVKIILDAGGHPFAPQPGMTIINAGWQAAMPETQRKEIAAPAWTEGAALSAGVHSRLDERKTKAPAIFTDGSLLSKLENLGLGTPATRAALIERLISTGFVQREKKYLMVTPKGFETVRVLLSIVPEVTSPELTATWEKRLSAIEEGTLTYGDFMASVRSYLRDSVADLSNANIEFSHTEPEGVAVCPICKGKILDRSTFFGCASYRDKGCKFTLPKKWGGKNLTPAIVRTLCEKGCTGYLKFKGQKGEYEARLTITPQDGGAYKLQPEFKQHGTAKG